MNVEVFDVVVVRKQHSQDDSFSISTEQNQAIRIPEKFQSNPTGFIARYFFSKLKELDSIKQIEDALPFVNIFMGQNESIHEYRIPTNALKLILYGSKTESVESLGLPEVKRRVLKFAAKNTFRRAVRVYEGSLITIPYSMQELGSKVVSCIQELYLTSSKNVKVGITTDFKVVKTDSTNCDDLIIEFYDSNEPWLSDAGDLDASKAKSWQGKSGRDLKYIINSHVEHTVMFAKAKTL